MEQASLVSAIKRRDDYIDALYSNSIRLTEAIEQQADLLKIMALYRTRCLTARAWSGPKRVVPTIQVWANDGKRRSRRSFNRPCDGDENASPNEASNQIADPTCERDTEEAEQPTSDGSSHDAEHDIHQNSHLALHDLFGEPAGDSANDDRCDPADCLVFHRVPPIAWGQAILTVGASGMSDCGCSAGLRRAILVMRSIASRSDPVTSSTPVYKGGASAPLMWSLSPNRLTRTRASGALRRIRRAA